MKFSSIVVSFTALLVPTVFAQTTVTVSYDQTYDTGSQSLNTVACSDGPNGLESKGYTTFDSLPDFPYIGGAAAVGGWDSAECGTCWALTYDGITINVLAIDSTLSGFNIALTAMNALTDNQAEFLGRVDASAVQVDASVCGL
ncbi:hypothetical protein POSPLADRAFT_1178475 [Postia placenta MAD-698-R-SB12]|uniref:Cerato-platanin n=1 Tax=Postia placenta MAD-698-R-SB12 TaxID=670580 RepID=A0A1X6N8E0_9APHY|nr:hypothetical protein POSPLADRAFT_1178475 [Postia placenta MAD-698-R-SB12]OSX64905.1 hypothetical protein POSPLADRAFT_1178475 [Postia placenta MAD-698-R-SB12]